MARRKGIEFCCLAIPLVNAGAYLIALSTLFISLCLVILSLIPPQIVATIGVLPPWIRTVLAILSGLSIALQLFGILTIVRQSTPLYRAYICINFALTLAIIFVSTIGTIWMVKEHEAASNACTLEYGNVPYSSGRDFKVAGFSDALKGSGKKICEVFTYVQIGAVVGLIVLVGGTQLYLCLCQRAYGKQQREAAEKYAVRQEHE